MELPKQKKSLLKLLSKAIMEYAVECRSKRTKKFVEAIMPNMIALLGLKSSKHCVLVRIANELDGDEGVTVPIPDINSYIVVVKPGSLKDVGTTLAHEMIHVKQLARGYLQIKNGARYWCGRRYRKNVKYLSQPWELDAFSKQEIIFRLAVE
jgi:hypothetical protein